MQVLQGQKLRFRGNNSPQVVEVESDKIDLVVAASLRSCQ